MTRREYTADDIESWQLKPGKGYDKVSTEVFRQTALDVIHTLESRLERVNAELAVSGSQKQTVDIKQIAASLSKEELEMAGLAAIGLELVDARARAESQRKHAARQAHQTLQTAREMLRAAAHAVEQGQSPTATAIQVRLALGQAIEKLGGSLNTNSTAQAAPGMQIDSREPQLYY